MTSTASSSSSSTPVKEDSDLSDPFDNSRFLLFLRNELWGTIALAKLTGAEAMDLAKFFTVEVIFLLAPCFEARFDVLVLGDAGLESG